MRTYFLNGVAYFITCGLGVSSMVCEAARASVTGQDVPATAPGTTELKPDQIPIPLELVEVPSDREGDRYIQLLQLSEPQRLALWGLFAEWQKSYREGLRTTFPELLPLATKAAPGLGQGQHDVQTTQNLVQFYERQEAFNTAMMQRDEQFFQKFQQILTEEQRLAMPRVVSHRVRSRSGGLFGRIIRSARIDLSRMLEEMPLELDVEEWSRLDAIMSEYELEVTPSWQAEDAQRQRTNIEHERILHRWTHDDDGVARPHDDPSGERLYNETTAALEKLLRPQSQLELDIAKVNRAWLPKLIEALPPRQGQEFRRLFLAKAYPGVFPDPTDPSVAIERITNDPKMDDELKAGLDAMYTAFKTQYEAISAKMMEAEDEWWARFAATSTSDGMTEHEAAMSKWRQDRSRAVRNLFAQAESIVPPAILNDHHDELRRVKNTIEFLETREATLEEMRQAR